MTSRAVAPMVWRERTRSSTVAPSLSSMRLTGLSWAETLVWRTTWVVPVEENGRRLRDLEVADDVDGEASVEDGDGLEDDGASDDDGAGALVDDDFGARKDGDLGGLDLGEERGDVFAGLDGEVDAAAVDDVGGGVAEVVVDSVSYGFGAAEVGVVEEEREGVAALEVEGDGALDDGSEGYAGGVGVVDLAGVAIDADGVASDDERALGLGVDLSVGSVERGHQEKAAFKAASVARG